MGPAEFVGVAALVSALMALLGGLYKFVSWTGRLGDRLTRLETRQELIWQTGIVDALRIQEGRGNLLQHSSREVTDKLIHDSREIEGSTNMSQKIDDFADTLDVVPDTEGQMAWLIVEHFGLDLLRERCTAHNVTVAEMLVRIGGYIRRRKREQGKGST